MFFSCQRSRSQHQEQEGTDAAGPLPGPQPVQGVGQVSEGELNKVWIESL